MIEMIHIKHLVEGVVDTGETIKITDDQGEPLAVILSYDNYLRFKAASERIRAFARNCVEQGDMTPSAKFMWYRIADELSQVNSE